MPLFGVSGEEQAGAAAVPVSLEGHAGPWESLRPLRQGRIWSSCHSYCNEDPLGCHRMGLCRSWVQKSSALRAGNKME